jgi:ribonuclease BN (tRNA processing enzyme)
MELLVVGSGAAYPDRPGTASSCYVVSHDGAAICLDIGQGAFAGLAGRLEPADVAGVIVSHLHPDHFVDLVALRHYLRFEFNPPRRVRVIAPAGLQDRLDGVTGERDFAAWSLEIEDRGEGQVRVGPFLMESRRVTHTDDSFATRVALAAAPDGPALVYSGDCGRVADLVPLIRAGDLLLCEVAFGPGPVPVPDLHLDGAAVGRLAAETRVSQLLLTHLQMNRDPAATLSAVRAAYGGPVSLVGDGDRISITG